MQTKQLVVDMHKPSICEMCSKKVLIIKNKLGKTDKIFGWDKS